jgi:hypothetical protein
MAVRMKGGAHARIRTEDMPIPSHVVMRGMRELDQSCAHMLAQCFRQHAEGRMPEADLDKVLRSVAWQSTALGEYYASRDAAHAQDAEHDSHTAELLSEDEVKSLLL